MLRKPFFAAGRAAKSRPPVLCFCYLHHRPAVSAQKSTPDNDRTDFVEMLPIQPFTASRAKLDPPVCRFCHPHHIAAFQAAKDTQRRFFLRSAFVIVCAVPMGIPAAIGTAVFLRHPASRKLSAARSANGLPFHKHLQPSPAEIYLMSSFSKTRKKDSIRLRCLQNTLFITGHTYPRILAILWA